MRWLMLFVFPALVACQSYQAETPKERVANMLAGIQDFKGLIFSCKREIFPVSNADAETLFLYARWLEKTNLLKQDLGVYGEIERIYRIAAENDHPKANVNLQFGTMRGHYKLRGHEHLRLSQKLIDAGVATGYYLIADFLKRGVAGLERDHEMAIRFYEKAAVEGNAYAQEYLADRFAPITIAPDSARRLRYCAAENGNGEAALMLAINLAHRGEYQESLEVLQLAVAAGNAIAGFKLAENFSSTDHRMRDLGLEDDFERAERYEKIWQILGNYSYADPKVPELNEIVPLPPAKLPPWDGKLQWLEERLANVPPPKPSEALIQKLAKEKGLDPATGKPMPGSPAFSAFEFRLERCRSGEPCLA